MWPWRRFMKKSERLGGGEVGEKGVRRKQLS